MSRNARIELHPVKLTCYSLTTGGPCTRHRPGGCPRDRKPSARPHYLRLVAANGQVLAHSETYSTRANARRAARAWRFAMYDVIAIHGDPDRPLFVEFDADGNQR